MAIRQRTLHRMIFSYFAVDGWVRIKITSPQWLVTWYPIGLTHRQSFVDFWQVSTLVNYNLPTHTTMFLKKWVL